MTINILMNIFQPELVGDCNQVVTAKDRPAQAVVEKAVERAKGECHVLRVPVGPRDENSLGWALDQPVKVVRLTSWVLKLTKSRVYD